MIIELKKYNKVWALLMGKYTTGLHEHIHHQERGQGVSVAMVAVHMGKERTEG